MILNSKLAYITLCSFFLVLLVVSCQDKPEQRLMSETRQVARQFDFENANFDFLDALVEGKNIVLLGEAGHGDGKTFLLKKDVIAYLNQKHGFNTLVMEGGSPFALNEILKNDTLNDADKILEYRRSIFPIWTFSNEFIPTLTYAIEADIKIIGMESQFSIWNNSHLMKRLYSECKLQDDANLTRFRNLFYELMGQQFHLLNEADNYEFFTEYLESMESKLKESDLPSKELNILYNSLKSIKVTIDGGLLNQEGLTDRPKINNARDSMMFENFLIQYDENEKYIVWLANFHAVKNIKQITYDGISDVYQKQKLFGSYMNEKFDENSVVLATISDKGYNGYAFQEASDTIQGCSDCPIVRSLNFDENQSYFVPTSIYSKELREANMEFNSIIFGVPHIGNWINQVDGIFILSDMTRSTLYDQPIHLSDN